jgi:hypothetical protein
MIDHGMAALFHRTLTSAERSFHKTLKTLQETKKAARMLVAAGPASIPAVRKAVSGFLPQNREATPPTVTEMFAAAQSNLGLSASELLKLLQTAA